MLILLVFGVAITLCLLAVVLFQGLGAAPDAKSTWRNPSPYTGGYKEAEVGWWWPSADTEGEEQET